MRREMKREFNSPLPGGLSVLSIDFTSKSLSWAGNIYQKWVNICLDNILIETPCKYADAFGEHFKRMLDEVADDWLNPCDGCAKGSIFNLPAEHEIICEDCENSELGPHENSTVEKLAMSIELKPFVSSVNGLSPEKSDERVEPNSTIAEDANSCLDGTVGSCKSVSEPVTNVVISDVASALLSHDKVLPSEYGGNKVVEEGSTVLGQTVSEKMNGTTYDAHKADDVSNHEEMEPISEHTERFEDLYLNKSAEDFDLCEAPHYAHNKLSFKKKLRQLFRSKVLSPKESFVHVENRCVDTDLGMQKHSGAAASSVSNEWVCPKISSTPNSSDSDWEIL